MKRMSLLIKIVSSFIILISFAGVSFSADSYSLEKLIQKACEGNPLISAAEERVLQAEGALQEAGAKMGPKFGELERQDTLVRMGFYEMQADYPNPADRFVRSVNITKALRKETFDIRYSGFGYYGSEMLFYLVESFYPPSELGRSVLKIEEESASYILPIINDVYPYIGARHYTRNYIPYEMWQDIIKRINEIKELIINDTYNDKLTPYINKFNLFALSKSVEDNDLIHNDEMRFVYERRYKIAHLYDIFLQWLDRQLFDADCIINVQGP